MNQKKYYIKFVIYVVISIIPVSCQNITSITCQHKIAIIDKLIKCMAANKFESNLAYIKAMLMSSNMQSTFNVINLIVLI